MLADQPRTIGLRTDAGRWIQDPQHVYDKMRAVLSKTQVTIPEVFSCDDPAVCPVFIKLWEFIGQNPC